MFHPLIDHIGYLICNHFGNHDGNTAGDPKGLLALAKEAPATAPPTGGRPSMMGRCLHELEEAVLPGGKKQEGGHPGQPASSWKLESRRKGRGGAIIVPEDEPDLCWNALPGFRAQRCPSQLGKAGGRAEPSSGGGLGGEGAGGGQFPGGCGSLHHSGKRKTRVPS